MWRPLWDPKRPKPNSYGMATHRSRNNQPNMCRVLARVTPTAKKTGEGTPKRAMSRPGGAWRPPPQLRRARPRPNYPRTPASRASVKGRDPAVVMEPDGRQIDASSAALRPRPNNPLDSLARCCPQQRHGAGPDRRNWPRTGAPQPVMQRAWGCRLPGAARVLAKGGNHAPACKKKT